MIWDGKKISKPAIYDRLPMDVYHGDCCVGPSLSASNLKLIFRCPVKYWAVSPYNPKPFPSKQTKPMALGRAAHALALGDPIFSDEFYVLPEDAPRRPSKVQRKAKKPSADTIAAIKFWDDVKATGKTVLTAEDMETVELMKLGLEHSPQVANAFRNGKPEQSLIWQDKETGIWCKSRPDWFPDDHRQDFILDYKSTESIDPYRLSNHVFDLNYHVQAAMQVDGTRAVFGTMPLGIAHICQEKEPPYLAELRMFTPEQIEHGRKIYRAALRRAAECFRTGTWPGYTADPQYFETPYRVAQQAQAMEPQDGKYSSVDLKNRNGRGGKAEPSAADYANTP